MPVALKIRINTRVRTVTPASLQHVCQTATAKWLCFIGMQLYKLLSQVPLKPILVPVFFLNPYHDKEETRYKEETQYKQRECIFHPILLDQILSP